MRNLIVTLTFALITSGLFAQKFNTDPDKKIDFSVDVFYDIWQNLPGDAKNKGISFGNSFQAMYERHIWKKDGTFRLALGGGITTHKLSMDQYIRDIKDVIEFTPIDDAVDYKKSKLVVNYLDFIAELRFKSPSKIRFAIGARVGLKIGSHFTYNGQRVNYSSASGAMVKASDFAVEEKVIFKGVDPLEKIKFGPTIRLGYKFFNLYAYYSITKLFDEVNGPQVYPISIGITFNPF